MTSYSEGLGLPNTNNLNTATPADAEAINLLPAALRQVKSIYNTHLAVSLDPVTGQLKAGIVTSAANAAQGIIGACDLAVPTNSHIKAGSLGTEDYGDLELTGAAAGISKITAASIGTTDLADEVITGPKIKGGEVCGAAGATYHHIGAGTIGTTDLAANAVTADKLADNAATETKIANGAVTSDKIAAAGIATNKITSGADAQILVCKSGGWTAVTLSGAGTISNTGVLTLTSGLLSAASIVTLSEVPTKGYAGGPSEGPFDVTTWALTGNRGSGITWTLAHENFSATPFSVASNGTLTVQAAGVGKYLVRCSAPAYSVGYHCLLFQLWRSPVLVPPPYFGPNEFAGAGEQTHATLDFVVTLAAADQFRIRHWTQLVKATNGFGIPCSVDDRSELYCFVSMIRL